MGKEGQNSTRHAVLKAIDALRTNTYGRREKTAFSLASPDISYVGVGESLWEEKMFKFVHLHPGFLNNPSDHLLLGSFQSEHAELVRGYIQSKTNERIPLAAVQKLGYLNAGILRKGQKDQHGQQSYLLLSGSGGLKHSYTGEDGKIYQRHMIELFDEYPDYATYVSFQTQHRLYTSIPIFTYQIG